MVAATVRAIQLLGRQFVLGRTIAEAMGEAASARKDQLALRFSYDMLGEGARTEADARRYLASYLDAITHIAAGRVAANPEAADGISIKLSSSSRATKTRSANASSPSCCRASGSSSNSRRGRI